MNAVPTLNEWAEIARRLREGFLDELRNEPALLSPYVGDALGHLVSVTEACQDCAALIDDLEVNEPDAYAAMQRAMQGLE